MEMMGELGRGARVVLAPPYRGTPRYLNRPGPPFQQTEKMAISYASVRT